MEFAMHECCISGKRERFLIPAVLYLLSQSPDHGYNILQRLERYGFDPSSPDPGSLYRLLRKLESDGMISSTWESGDYGPAKRVYRITDEGSMALTHWIKMLKQNVSHITQLITDAEDLQ